MASAPARLAVAAALGLMPGVALAQGTPVYQSGVLSQAHDLAKLTRNGQIQDVGGILGDSFGRGVNPFAITDGGKLALCSNTALTSLAYSALCFGHDAAGNGLITLDSYGTGSQGSLNFRLNGTLYSFPAMGSGILGPESSTPGNAVVFNNSSGTLVKDAGAPAKIHVPNNVALKALTGLVSGAVVARDGFTTAGDGGAADYIYSPVTCSLNAGAGDNGSQATASGGGCLLGQFTDYGISPFVFGAIGDGGTNDTDALNATYAAAIRLNKPISLGSATYKVTSTLSWDFAILANGGLHIKSAGAVVDGRTIGGSSNVLKLYCSGGSPSAPTSCYRQRIDGTLLVQGNTTGYVVVFGLPNYADALNEETVDQLGVQNFSATGGGIQVNYITGGRMFMTSSTAGSGHALSVTQATFVQFGGSWTAINTNSGGSLGWGLALEGSGIPNSNTFVSADMEVGNGLLITSSGAFNNTFMSPNFSGNSSGNGSGSATAVRALAGNNNVLVSPNYNGLGSNLIDTDGNTVGLRVIGGSGNRSVYRTPTAASYTTSGLDDGAILSSFNSTVTTFPVTLGTVPQPGWQMSYVTDNSHGMTITPAAGTFILYGGKQLASLTLPAGDYKIATLTSDGSEYRLASADPQTLRANGLTPGYPGNWVYPTAATYAGAAGDNGSVFSSGQTSAGLTLTLPSTTAVSSGYTIGGRVDSSKPLTINVNGTSGGHILYPGSGASVTSLALTTSTYEMVWLQYDGNGNWSVLSITPTSAAALGIANTGNVFIGGNAAAAIGNSATGPFMYLSSTAGTPTGVPTGAAAGRTACQYDTTAHKLWCYDQPAGAWRGVVLN